MSIFLYSGFIPICCRWCDVPWLLQALHNSCSGWRVRPRVWSFYIISPMCFCWRWSYAGYVFKLCWWCFETMLLPLLLNLGCNNTVETLMYENYLWTCCNMWLVVLNHVWAWFVRWLFEILHDFIGLPGLYGFKYDGLIASVIAIVLVLL